MQKQDKHQLNHQHVPGPFDIAMMLLSAFAMIIVICIFVAPIDAETRRLLLSIDTFICFVFIIHFIISTIKADSKVTYFKRHWLELLASVPLIEQLRLLRLLQIFRVIKMLTLAKDVFIPMLAKRIQTTMAGLLVFMITIVASSAVAIFIIESDNPDSNIKTAEDALWWGLVTISTVGYGDYYPVTSAGRLISSILIISGVSLFGVISGYIASSFSRPSAAEEQEEETDRAILKQLLIENRQLKHEMQAELKQLRTELEKFKQE
ncbi:potassium channel family protein [Catenovulum adriaticum]|nr:ion transporter [Catenovulum sp. TS8]